MKKGNYVSPSTEWFWIGLDESIADITTGGVETSSPRSARENNVWADENEDATGGTTSGSKSIWDNEW